MHAKRLLILLLATTALVAESIPKGLEPVFKGVEKGKRFHAFWPPASGAEVLGTIVIAKDPGKPQALFSTIDSPDYRSPTYTKAFKIGVQKYTAPDLTQIKNLSADVAFGQLDALFNAVKDNPKADQLTGQDSNKTTDKPTSEAAKPEPPKPDTAKPAASVKPTDSPKPADPAKPADAPKPADTAKTSKKEEKERTVTGVDFSIFRDISVKLTGLQVSFYDVPTLTDLKAGTALTASAKDLLTKENKGWIIHRVLTIQTIEYTCVSKDQISGGLFAKLVGWIPTVKVGYKNDKTVTLTTTSPITIGYKLWRPDIPLEGVAVNKINLAELGLGVDEIDQILGLQ